jgi:hypothetical protein
MARRDREVARLVARLSILLSALGASLLIAAVPGHGMSLGLHHSASSGGAFGSSAAAPGTNSLGTALPSSGRGHRRMKGPPLGTGNPAVDREDAQVARTVHSSICRGC